MKIQLSIALAVVTSASASMAQAQSGADILLRSDVQFQPLNPARGDASPKAGVLWGDIKKDVPSGAIIEFTDGFSSPPHIHNITYRGVVIEGFVHNDDPDAENMWMGPGSFWTQPAGETHITAASNGGATIFLEILEGPYLVQPSSEAFATDERPINLDASNVIWLNSADMRRIEHADAAARTDEPEMTYLWGSPREGELNGSLIKLPAGGKAELNGNGAQLHAVIIKGDTSHQLSSDAQSETLPVGSYFGSAEEARHQLICESEEECLVYVRTEGAYELAL